LDNLSFFHPFESTGKGGQHIRNIWSLNVLPLNKANSLNPSKSSSKSELPKTKSVLWSFSFYNCGSRN